jgi:serine/threonine protein phosphatase PrpC
MFLRSGRRDDRLAFLGTCVITLEVSDENSYIANLGDSKARLFRGIWIKLNR